MKTALIILAAGQGSRMKSDLPKVLHEVAGAPLLVHAMKSGAAVTPEKTVIVVGHGGALVEKAAKLWDNEINIATQSEQLGTGHAVLQAREALGDFDGDCFVLYGDTPFTSGDTLTKMHQARQGHDVVVLGFEAKDPARYGRLIMDGDKLLQIVEFKDASENERAVTFCNSGVICANSKTLMQLLDKVENDNASAEYYLTDIIEIARDQGLSTTAITCSEDETMGINTRAQLADAERIYQDKFRAELMIEGVTLIAPETVYFAHDTVIGRDTVIEPNVQFGQGVTIESGARIRAFTHIEGAHVSRGSVIGPFARLRTGTEIAEDARVGNFVEIKNSILDEGVKVGHLTYLGDTDVGAETNIGAGTVTCNYDGVSKHRTRIGSGAFIGSDTMLVAPVSVGDDAMTATGSVITKDVPPMDLAIARAKQENKTGLAKKLFEKLRSAAAK